MAMEQAIDFRAECAALYELLRTRATEEFRRPTQFKQWTIDDILRHLAVWDHAAGLTLRDGAAFDRFFEPVPAFNRARNLRGFEKTWFAELEDHALLRKWHDGFEALAAQFSEVDPRRRLRWGGPELSARSCITSRQMEVWAHGQAVYDELGVERPAADRISNIVVLGINTFSWTFSNRGMPAPPVRPAVALVAPSGRLWRWEGATDSHIEGSAVEFCQVVTQVRNVRDTRLEVVGEIAGQWMELAQCFAGPPEQPPAPGTRFIKHGAARDSVAAGSR